MPVRNAGCPAVITDANLCLFSGDHNFHESHKSPLSAPTEEPRSDSHFITGQSARCFPQIVLTLPVSVSLVSTCPHVMFAIKRSCSSETCPAFIWTLICGHVHSAIFQFLLTSTMADSPESTCSTHDQLLPRSRSLRQTQHQERKAFRAGNDAAQTHRHRTLDS